MKCPRYNDRDGAPHPEEEGGDVEGEDGVPVEDDGEAEDQVQSTSDLLCPLSQHPPSGQYNNLLKGTWQ